MKKIVIFYVLLIETLVVCNVSFAAAYKTVFIIDPASGKNLEVVDGELLVKFKSGTKKTMMAVINNVLGTQVRTVIASLNIQCVKLPAGKSIRQMIELYKKDPNVEYAEPNYIRKAFITTPNDYYYPQQWHLKKMDCDLIWDVETGSSAVVIAVIDSGINYSHEDLTDNMWVNTDEISSNSVDDDSNTFIDDVKGWDFADNDNNPMDVYGHGTEVAGAAAARGDNGKGVAGVTWYSKIMNVRVLDSYGVCVTSTLISGIEYAADNGADIINLSLGGSDSSDIEQAVMNDAYAKGCLIIAATGNDNYSSISFPAGYEHVIAVGAVNNKDIRCCRSEWGDNCGEDGKSPCGSNYGSGIDVVAPGNDIVTTVYKDYYGAIVVNGYNYASGTSLAAPLVSGVAALIKSYYPQVTNLELEDRLKFTADDITGVDPTKKTCAAGWDQYTGYGRVNARSAIEADYFPDSVRNIHPDNNRAINYPNPFIPSKDGATTIVFVTSVEPSGLSIYNIAGERVFYIQSNHLVLYQIRSLAGDAATRQLVYKYDWNGKSNIDKDVAAGIYIYVAETSEGSKRGKLALIR